MPPLASVEKISWNETSKLSDANWSVTSPGPADEFANCQWMRLRSTPRRMATPFGVPVEPDV